MTILVGAPASGMHAKFFSEESTDVAIEAPLSNPGVRFPPPVIFVGGFLLGWLLDRYWHALPLSRIGGSAVEPLGWGLLAIGVILAASGLLTFRRARTAIIPSHGASRLVTDGPYRYTRNPMYTGLTIVSVGAAALIDSAWPLIMLPVVLMALVRLVISREEAYLSDAFGAEYMAYQARVRRWL
jgi:protein-S-isoprenylcysteine O-methyltransferase Ste14